MRIDSWAPETLSNTGSGRRLSHWWEGGIKNILKRKRKLKGENVGTKKYILKEKKKKKCPEPEFFKF
jgi:hypothetical protein